MTVRLPRSTPSLRRAAVAWPGLGPAALVLLLGACDRADGRVPSGAGRSPAAVVAALEPPTPATLADHVVQRARALAAAPYAAPDTVMPAALARMGYEQYRGIQYRPEAALWRGEGPFEVQLFHPGFLYREAVRIHVVDERKIALVPFDGNRFRYEGGAAELADVVAPQLGYAGFRVHYPLNDSTSKDEIVVFLGASYFRLLGPGHAHGLSSRGLAVDIGLDSGEEFPDFREFWLVKPAPGDSTLTIHALLDSPSVSGAYRFTLVPGENTTLEVDARLFARRDVGKLGIAPLTSMFLYGPDRPPGFDDFRPQVHDSDGLLMQTAADAWIWRPLSNGPGLHLTSLRDHTPRGFGLVQRDRDFEHYLDLEAQYHRRPSEWVETLEGDWGQGGVELLEIPTESEFNDNVVAYWVSDAPFRAGEERRYRYRLTTFDARLDRQTLAQVERTRIGWDALPGQGDPPPRSQRRVVVDFAGGPLEAIAADAGVEAVLRTSAGRISDLTARPLPDGGWRASFRLEPDGDRPADMQLHLAVGERRLSESWSYVWYPDRAR